MVQGRLTSANVGDSGYLVLGRTPHQRHFHVKYRSPQQEHNFGVPYQLGHNENADVPSDAMLMTLPVGWHSSAAALNLLNLSKFMPL